MVGLAVLLVVSLLTMKSGRRELVDKVKGEVISEGPETEGGVASLVSRWSVRF